MRCKTEEETVRRWRKEIRIIRMKEEEEKTWMRIKLWSRGKRRDQNDKEVGEDIK
jgi:hypothetical protein